MDRRRFLLTSLAGAVAAPLGAESQQTQSPRIGYLSSGKRGFLTLETEGLRQGLRELGSVEGRNIEVEYRLTSTYVNTARPLLGEHHELLVLEDAGSV